MSDVVYLHQIQQLVNLQKVDDEIFSVRQELENAPRNLEELEQQFAVVDARRSRIRDKLDHLIEQEKRMSQENEQNAAKLQKSKNKLMQVNNEREFDAMRREMDSMEQLSRTREAERATLMEELQLQTAAFDEVDKEHSALKGVVDEKRASLGATLSECNAKLEELGKKRLEASESIPQPIFMRYEFIRNRLEHPVIVDVEDGICSGCHIAIPPQVFIDLQTGEQILSCPNCQRLIFWREHFDLPGRREKAAKKPEIAEDASEEELEVEDAESEEE